MYKFSELLTFFAKYINSMVRLFIAILMLALILAIALQIVSRFFGVSMNWTEEVARFILVWVTFLGATVAYHDGRHIAVDFLSGMVSAKLVFFFKVVKILVCLVFLGVAGYFSHIYMGLQSFQKSPSMGISMNNVYLVIPVSFSLIFIYMVRDLFDHMLSFGFSRQ